MSKAIPSCTDCVCFTCAHYRYYVGDCPYGDCIDDKRARDDPYPYGRRTGWSECDRPGEQEHWCRNGMFYPLTECGHYRRHEGKGSVKWCFGQNVTQYKEGVSCWTIRSGGSCEDCVKRWEAQHEAD